MIIKSLDWVDSGKIIKTLNNKMCFCVEKYLFCCK